MIGIKIIITRFVSNDFPGWIECRFRDAWGKEHIIEEKIPVVTTLEIDINSAYPLEGYIACEILNEKVNEGGNKILTVSTRNPWGISSVDGLIEFDLLDDQIFNL